MTSFVPDKPGVYWETHSDGTKQIVEVASGMSAPLVAYYMGVEAEFKLPSANRIAPVTPTDVVDDLVKALEAVTSLAEQAGCHVCQGDCSAAAVPVMGCPTDTVRAARAAIQRYRGKL